MLRILKLANRQTKIKIRPRILVQPTQFKNSTKNFKIEFPGNQAKIFISPESAQFIDSFWIFLSEKFPCKKKLLGVPYPGIHPNHNLWSIRVFCQNIFFTFN